MNNFNKNIIFVFDFVVFICACVLIDQLLYPGFHINIRLGTTLYKVALNVVILDQETGAVQPFGWSKCASSPVFSLFASLQKIKNMLQENETVE